MGKSIVLITGASGYLGRRLVARASLDYEVIAASHRVSPPASRPGSVAIDVTDGPSVARLVARTRPTAIIHTAAVNPGQGDELTMASVNIDGARNVATAAIEVGARLIHVSTDVVHDGKEAPYADDAAFSPLQSYGLSKAQAETEVRTIDPDSVIVRSSLIYAIDEIDRATAGFADHIAQGKRLTLFSDVLRNPIWAETLAEALVRLVHVDAIGVLNVGGRQVLSRDEFGRRMLAYWNISDRGLIETGYARDLAASVPRDLRLDSSQAESLLDMKFPGVDEVLASHPLGSEQGYSQRD